MSSSIQLKLVIAILLGFTTTAEAHELCLKAERREGKLYVEAWYDSDTPADLAKVSVLFEGRVLIEGKTDERGVWTTECPAAGQYRIRATDGGGHKTEIDFIVATTAEPQQAGTTKEEVSQRRWTGGVLGLGIVALLVVAGRWVLRSPSAA